MKPIRGRVAAAQAIYNAIPMNIFPLLLQLLSGMIGGTIAGKASEKLNLGLIGNALTGLVGGGIVGHFFLRLALLNSTDLSIFVASVAGGGFGGALALCVVDWARGLLGHG
jgi:hypothetical protein